MPCPKRLLVLTAPDAAEAPNAAAIREVFRPLAALGVQVVHVDTVADAARVIADQPVDVLVVTPSAVHPAAGPAVDSPTLNALTRRLERDSGLDQSAPRSLPPILVVADPEDPIPAVVAGRCLLDGAAWDIVRRDAPPEELLLRAEHLIAQAESSAELSRVRYQASHDDRTGLFRPGPFDERLRAHFSAAGRHRLELALVLVDLDRFGEVNKRYDHTVGDELIARAGSVIRMSLRAEDVGARIGGDEFALILPYTHKVAAARVVSRLTGRFRALSGPPPRHFRGPAAGGSSIPGEAASINVSASLGFETFDGSDMDTPDELRRRAEKALNTAKSRGGNQGVYYRNIDPMRNQEHEDEPVSGSDPLPPPPSDAGRINPFFPRREQRRG